MKRIIDWFIENPIAANLLVIVILFLGIKNLLSVGKTVFPQTDQSNINISASYQGASPSEVEQQVLIRLEEAIADLEGIDDIFSTARESLAQITISILKGYDSQRLLNDVESRIDAVITLPDEVDEVTIRESLPKRPLMSIAIHGDVDAQLLKETGQWFRDELSLLDSISTISLGGVRNNEMAIEISEKTLRKYGLTLNDVAARIRQTSLTVPGGVVKTDAGNVHVQTRGQVYSAEAFANIVIATTDNGGQLLLGDIANIVDGFEDVDRKEDFNGQPAAYLELFTSTPPDVLDAAAEVKAKIETLRASLPPSVELTIWKDRSSFFKSRMNLLLTNGLSGLLLVFIVLTLFLSPSLAAWVSVSIATAFVGVFVILPYTDITVNMLSMYGFLLALGIVVDDAIIVGESVDASHRRGQLGVVAAKEGAMLVYKPVLFSVISTIIFFSGMFGLPGWMGSLAYPIAIVVIVCFFFSLIESLLILPSHLSNKKPASVSRSENYSSLLLSKIRHFMSEKMASVARNIYRSILEKSLKNNGATLAFFLMIFIIVVVLYTAGGYVKTSFKVKAVSNTISITAVLAEGSSFLESQRIQQKIGDAARQLREDEQLKEINGEGQFIRAVRTRAVDNEVRVWVALMPTEEREVNIVQVKDRLRELIGDLEGVREFNLNFTINSNSKAIRFRLNIAGNNHEVLAQAVDSLKNKLQTYTNVYDVEDTLEGARREAEIRLKPYAEVLGLRLSDVARQVRQGFYGEEVQRISRGTEDIKVMLRYPVEERRNTNDIENIYIRSNNGAAIPLSSVAEVVDVPGYSVIRRENRRRTIVVSADVTEGTDAAAIAAEIIHSDLPQWQQQYRGLHMEMAGSLTEQKEFNGTLLLNMLIAIFVSYGLMAIAFRSYWQPLIILTAIPFGFVGAVLGHMIMQETVSIMSMLGFLACAGVVVNDNLILLDRIQRLRETSGECRASIISAVVQAGQDRFRAIILTSLTTFIGLLPIMFETSVQAQFLIPLVVSLSFGVLFATFITLLLVPNLFLLGERVVAKVQSWRA